VIAIGAQLEAVAGRGVQHLLDGIDVTDNTVLEVLTDHGWVSGHYRTQLHPESGAVLFEMHVSCDGGRDEHVSTYLPTTALVRWPVKE